MRELQIVLPNAEQDGSSLSRVHDFIAGELAMHLGGYTSHGVVGGWKAPDGRIIHEPGRFYSSVGPDEVVADLANSLPLSVLAQTRQECIYVRTVEQSGRWDARFVQWPQAANEEEKAA